MWVLWIWFVNYVGNCGKFGLWCYHAIRWNETQNELKNAGCGKSDRYVEASVVIISSVRPCRPGSSSKNGRARQRTLELSLDIDSRQTTGRIHLDYLTGAVRCARCLREALDIIRCSFRISVVDGAKVCVHPYKYTSMLFIELNGAFVYTWAIYTERYFHIFLCTPITQPGRPYLICSCDSRHDSCVCTHFICIHLARSLLTHSN